MYPTDAEQAAAQSSNPAGAVIELDSVEVIVDGRRILGPISWRVDDGQHWVVLGPNGGGKSTLVAVASLSRHPTEGEVTVLGHRLGRVDLRRFRSRIGICSAGLAQQLRGQLTAGEVVMCGLHAALEPWWHTYADADADRADELLHQVGLDGFSSRRFATLSSGERQRVLLARSLMADPDVSVLDEPTAGLDLEGRESLVAALESIATVGRPSTIFVTHHVEDIPATTTHVLALKQGTVLAAGPLEAVLNTELLESLFGIGIRLANRHGRWTAQARRPPKNSTAR